MRHFSQLTKSPRLRVHEKSLIAEKRPEQVRRSKLSQKVLSSVLKAAVLQDAVSAVEHDRNQDSD